MKKNILFSILFVGLSLTAFSQSRFGIIGGLNIAKYTVSGSGITITATTITSFHLGFLLDAPVTENIYFQPQLLLSGKGGKGPGGEATPYYIEAPFNFLYATSIGPGKILGGLGPYAAAGVFGKEQQGSISRNLKFGSGDNSDLKQFDFGINFIGGYEFDTGLLVNINYSLGLANILPGSSGNNANGYNRYFGISIGYLFGGTQY